MKRRYAEFERAGAVVLAVSFATPAQVAAFAAEADLPFPIVSDPDRAAYTALGLGRTSWWRIMRPASVWRYLRLIWRGVGPRKPLESADLLQLGGDVVLDGQRRVVWKHLSQEPTDRPAIDEMLRAVRGA